MIDFAKSQKQMNEYIERLVKSGLSYNAAVKNALDIYRKVKHKAADPVGTTVGICNICNRKIQHRVEEYSVSATNTGETEMWHVYCLSKKSS